jgi:hypothetical protein
MRTRLVMSAVIVLLLLLGSAGTAVWATHGIRGGFTEPTHLQFRTKTARGTQVINVRDASEVVVHTFGPFAMGTTGPWHTHPGPVLVIVNHGEFLYQHTDCSVDVYGPGKVALDPGQGYVHRAHFTAGTEVTAVFFGVPASAPHTNPVGDPGCPDPATP